MKHKYFIFFLLFSFFVSCSLINNNIVPKNLTYTEARNNIPIYDNFIRNFKEQGYEFWSFHKYLQADTSNLPQKLIVIRHDVHHRDIKNAYYMHSIEKELIGENVATYYVMLNFPLEKSTKQYKQWKEDYLENIRYLSTRNVDVQPHISPWDEYIEQYKPWWKSNSFINLKTLVSLYYSYIKKDSFYQIVYKSVDTLNFKDVEEKMPSLLKNYNNIWENETGLSVESYAAHGSETNMNHAFNNEILLNLKTSRESGTFCMETSSPEIWDKLKFLSDNERPLWMENPDSIPDGRYEFLAHPDVWENPQEYRDKYWK